MWLSILSRRQLHESDPPSGGPQSETLNLSTDYASLRIRAREGRRRRLRRRRPDRARIRLSLTTRYSASQLLRCSGWACVTQNGCHCVYLFVRAMSLMTCLLIVFVSCGLELVSKKDRMPKKIVPLKIRPTESSQLSLSSKSPLSYFRDLWFQHDRYFHDTRIYYMISIVLRFPIWIQIGIP